MKKYSSNVSFIESGLEFHFDQPWLVVRYDEHPFFRKFSGQGRKGVDFLAVNPGKELILLEVKNLAQYPGQDAPEGLATDLAGVVGQKVEDTLEGIDAIRQHYQRQWWDPLRRLSARCHLPLTFGEWAFWQKVIDLAGQPKQLVVIFWLETGRPADQLYADLGQFLREDLENLAGKVWISTLDFPPEISGCQIKFAS